MNYLQAVDKLKSDYAHLLNQKITNIKTNEIDSFDIITITPLKGGHGDYNWFDYLDLEYGKFLADKSCLIIFVLNYKRKRYSGGSFLAIHEDGLGNYNLPTKCADALDLR